MSLLVHALPAKPPHFFDLPISCIFKILLGTGQDGIIAMASTSRFLRTVAMAHVTHLWERVCVRNVGMDALCHLKHIGKKCLDLTFEHDREVVEMSEFLHTLSLSCSNILKSLKNLNIDIVRPLDMLPFNTLEYLEYFEKLESLNITIQTRNTTLYEYACLPIPPGLTQLKYLTVQEVSHQHPCLYVSFAGSRSSLRNLEYIGLDVMSSNILHHIFSADELPCLKNILYLSKHESHAALSFPKHELDLVQLVIQPNVSPMNLQGAFRGCSRIKMLDIILQDDENFNILDFIAPVEHLYIRIANQGAMVCFKVSILRQWPFLKHVTIVNLYDTAYGIEEDVEKKWTVCFQSTFAEWSELFAPRDGGGINLSIADGGQLIINNV